MDNMYKSNSHKSKLENKEVIETKKDIKKVVSGTTKPKKKTSFRKFTDVFISGDVADVKSYVRDDIVIPNLKKAIFDIVKNSIEIFLWGEASKSSKSVNASKVSYRSYYDKDNDRRKDSLSTKVKSGFDYDEIIFENRGDAEKVLSAMDDVIAQYDVVSIGDLYDLAGVSTDNHAIHRYGWTNIRSAEVLRVRDGYIIKFPKADALN